jgi:hypothetical protein
MPSRALFAALLPAVFSVAAAAGPLVATKPSQVVTLTVGGEGCAFGEAIALRVLADGTTAPFTIPEGQVLAINEVDWGIAFGPASSTLVIALSAQLPGAASPVPFFLDTAPSDGNGSGGTTSPVAQAIVASGATVCRAGGTEQGARSVIVRGFLAKAK